MSHSYYGKKSMTSNYPQAIDLMLEDLYTIHANIRNQAKIMNCEKELNEIRDDIIKYLKSYKGNNK